MTVYKYPDRACWAELMARPQMDATVIGPRVAAVLDAVRTEGDDALLRFTREFDGVELTDLEVSQQETDEATVASELAAAMKTAVANIEKFHRAQKHPDLEVMIADGIKCEQRRVAIERVGLYVPGGSAPLLSTVLMLAIPARIAGCREIILCTPPSKDGRINPAILYAARLCGVTRIFKAGGAQAIAAMAYGTRSIPKVDKIFGPGNQYVTAAKQQVSVSDVATDMPAGPSEVLVMADGSARADFVASDLLSQAEHGGDSQAILVTNSEALAEKTAEEFAAQMKTLSRSHIMERSAGNCRVIVLSTVDEMIEFANAYAAEHLIISTRDAWGVAGKITSAGSVFIGNYSPESAGDYASGTNHTLPTNGWARAYSGVNLDSFCKKITFQELSREGLASIATAIETLALAEGLDAHANAVRVRITNYELNCEGGTILLHLRTLNNY